MLQVSGSAGLAGGGRQLDADHPAIERRMGLDGVGGQAVRVQAVVADGNVGVSGRGSGGGKCDRQGSVLNIGFLLFSPRGGN